MWTLIAFGLGFYCGLIGAALLIPHNSPPHEPPTERSWGVAAGRHVFIVRTKDYLGPQDDAAAMRAMVRQAADVAVERAEPIQSQGANNDV